MCRFLLRNIFTVCVFAFPLIVHAGNNLPDALTLAIKESGFDQQGIGLAIHAVDATAPQVLFQASTPLNPASVIKLVTTAAALGTLGAGYQWSTQVLMSGKLEGDTLKGDLYFKGNGDPYLTPERFWRLLNRVSIFGIRTISGDVVFDNSYFDPETVDYAAFDNQPYRTYNVGPNALLVGFQATEFHFNVSSEHNNDKLNIIVFPQSPKIIIINKVKLTNGSCGAWQKRLTLNTKKTNDGLQVIFSGRYARACGKRTLYRRVTQADDHYQHYFLPLWQQIGGTVSGRVKQGRLPQSASPVLDDDSISLGEAIRLINKFSNNVMTRQVLLSLGAQVYGPPGTTEKGVAAVKAWLEKNNLADKNLILDNGAGLSRDTRITAAHLANILLFMFKQAYMPEYIASLPVLGYDGSMTNRFDKQVLAGSAHLKTGLLDFVQTMAGYVTTATGKRYVVVLLHNHPKAHTKNAERLQNSIIHWIYNL